MIFSVLNPRTLARPLSTLILIGAAGPATDKSPIFDLRMVVYHVPDIDRAKALHSAVLGFEPCFDQPYYLGFNGGGYERVLGSDPGWLQDPAAERAPTGASWTRMAAV